MEKIHLFRHDCSRLNFESRYWKGYGYSGSDFVDDQANAMAVLAQLCPLENYEKSGLY